MSKSLAFVSLLFFAMCAALPTLTLQWESKKVIGALAQKEAQDAVKQLEKQLHAFETLLNDSDQFMSARLRQALPSVVLRLSQAESLGIAFDAEYLSSVARWAGVNDVYLIDAHGVVAATSFAPDLGLNLSGISEDFRIFLDGLRGTGELSVAPVTVSVATGLAHKYAYFSPKGDRRIYEVSLNVRSFLAESNTPQYNKLLFTDLFTIHEGIGSFVESVDVYMGYTGGMWSLLHPGKLLNERISAQGKDDMSFVEQLDGNKVIYRFLKPSYIADMYHYLFCIEVTLKQDVADSLAKTQLEGAMLSTVLMALIGLSISFLLFQRFWVKPVDQINQRLDRIAQGDLSPQPALSGTDGFAQIVNRIDETRAKLADRETQLNKVMTELDQLASRDKLTGAMTRWRLDEALEHEIASHARNGRDLSVLMFDVDHFKRVNDDFGHQVGDATLQRLCDIVRQRLRSSDLFGRYGGEEFVVVLPDTDARTATALAEQLRQIVQDSQMPTGRPETISIGVSAVFAKESLGKVYRRVDQALYAAKRTGRNRVVSLG